MSMTVEKTIEIPAPPKRLSERDLSSGFRRSLFFHLALALFILLKSVIFPGDPVPYTPTLRVDVVGLPDILKKDLNQLPKLPPPPGDLGKTSTQPTPAKAAPAAPAPELAEKDELVFKPKAKTEAANPRQKGKEKNLERKNQSALARIKALARLSGTDTPAREKTQAQGRVIRGNTISKGTQLSGDAREAAEAGYYDLLRDQLQENWALPVWIARQKLSARVQIFVDAYGKLRSYRIVKGSGNPQFDEAVKRTLQASQPFPAPPEAIASSVLTDGVLVGFPL